MLARPVLLAVTTLALAAGAGAAPADEAIIPAERYSTEKGRTLGRTFADNLRRIYSRVYHCRPWLDVHKGGLGFTRPVGAEGDSRYLNIWVWVDQKITPEFAALGTSSQRASAMFSRYGVDLLRQLSADPHVFAHPYLTGYSVILTWIKPNGRVGNDEVAETLGVFADKSAVRAYLRGEMTAEEFVRRATVVAFDGEAKLGRLPLTIWDDDFSTTFKPKDYEPEDRSVRC